MTTQHPRLRTGDGIPPLAGRTVGVTAARRADELSTLLRRRGAEVVEGAALRIVPVQDDADLLAGTRGLIAHPADVVVATTGVGFRGWLEAASGWGVGEELLARLGGARLLARGPKAKGAIRAAGLVEEWSPASESSAEVLEWLLREGVAGLRIAVQLHGTPLREFVDPLEAAGAEVVVLPVYRWVPPLDLAPLDRVVDACVGGGLDALTFTSAPAVLGLLERAGSRGLRDRVEAALRQDVLPVCVGPVTAAPLDELGIPSLQPPRARLASMVQVITTELPLRAPRPSGVWSAEPDADPNADASGS